MDVSISDPLLPSHKNPAWQILKVMEFSPIHLVCFRIKSKTQVFEFKVWEGVCVCVCVCEHMLLCTHTKCCRRTPKMRNEKSILDLAPWMLLGLGTLLYLFCWYG